MPHEAIPWIISFLSLCVCILTYVRNGKKDLTAGQQKEDEKFSDVSKGILKANLKLDQVCATTNETRSDIKALNKDLKDMDTRVVILERDMKTAFNQIKELKGEIHES